MSVPKDKNELRSFLGLCSYYRKFIFNFAKLVFSLHELTHKDIEYLWTESHQQIFDTLKSLFVQNPILKHPNFDYPFIIHTDACDIGIGAVLRQVIDNEEHVVQFISRTLQPEERKWCVREKEALAIIWAFQQFKPYISGSRFQVQTDHHSLKWLREATSPPRLVRWALSLSEFDFDIIYKKGSANSNADCLSRLPISTSIYDPQNAAGELDNFLYSLSVEPVDILPKFTNEYLRGQQKNDNLVRRIYYILETQNTSPDNRTLAKSYSIQDN